MLSQRYGEHQVEKLPILAGRRGKVSVREFQVKGTLEPGHKGGALEKPGAFRSY